jgi:hypothetical protein
MSSTAALPERVTSTATGTVAAISRRSEQAARDRGRADACSDAL